MITVDGKAVYTDLSEMADPKRTALLLVDMQRDFIDPDGVFGQLGIDLSMYEQTRPKLEELLAAARRNRVLIVHIQNTALPDRMSDSPAQIHFNLRIHRNIRGNGPALLYTVPGTNGHKFSREFTPGPGELVVRKYRSSGFWGTNLGLLLRSNGIETVVVGGCTTEGCVESTARDAMFNDYYVVVAEDCVGSDDQVQHEASMMLMRHRFDVETGAEIGRIWESAQTGKAEKH